MNPSGYLYWVLPCPKPVENESFSSGANALLLVTYLKTWEVRRIAEFEHPEEAYRVLRALTSVGMPPLPFPAPKLLRASPRRFGTPAKPVELPTSWRTSPSLTRTLQDMVRFLTNHPELHDQFVTLLEGTGWTFESLMQEAVPQASSASTDFGSPKQGSGISVPPASSSASYSDRAADIPSDPLDRHTGSV